MSVKSTYCGASVFILILLLSGCKSREFRKPHLTDGTYWMTWSSAKREAFVKDFATGYTYGAQETCAGAGGLWRREFEPDDPKEKELASNLGMRCQASIDGFSKFRLSGDRYPDASPYVDLITAYYKTHPNRQDVGVVSLLMGLRDSTFSQAEHAYQLNGNAEK
jgi:hypothetical protein